MNTNNSKYNCPSCGSENTRKLSLINSDGISKLRGTVSIGSKVGSFFGTRQTKSSKEASPPVSPTTLLIRRIVLILFLSYFIKTFFGIFSLTVTGIFIVISIIKHVKYSKEYPGLARQWHDSYGCQRCEKVFTLQQGLD